MVGVRGKVAKLYIADITGSTADLAVISRSATRISNEIRSSLAPVMLRME